MRNNRMDWLAVCLGLTMLFSSCTASLPAAETPTPLDTAAGATDLEAAEHSSEPAVASAQPPTPEPSPAPDPETILEAISQVDILGYIPADLYARSDGQRWYEPVLEKSEETLGLPAAYLRWIDDAADVAHEYGIRSVALRVNSPTWPMLAAIVANYYGDPENMRAALVKAGGIRCEVSPTSGGGYSATIIVDPPDAPTLMYDLPETETTNPFSLMAAYAYLSTVFDENMTSRDGIGTPELEELLFPIVRPERYWVGDCWAQPRDGGARLHTGIDINAPAGTDLLAVTDGVILDNGYNSVAGNFLVLQSPSGVQYHYYHLIEPSELAPGTAVRTGDVVAHVGSTGNSRANHLHFTIITPEGHYVNPYAYMLEAQQRTVAQNAAAA